MCVSQSGESAETVRVAEALAERAPRPDRRAVTNGADNSLAGSPTSHLDTRGGEEHGPSTMTFAATLVMMAAVAGRWSATSRAPAPTPRPPRRRAAAGQIPSATPRRWRTGWGTGPCWRCSARGEARAAAEMGALTLKEAARFPAESLQAAQFRHGPLELAGPELAAVVFASAAATRDLDLGLAEELVAAGRPCW